MVNYVKQIYVSIFNVVNSEKGQTLVEYALLLILVAIVVVLLVKGIGLTANNVYSQTNSALQG
jgi:pilus assembly protein Flp/PilA